MRGSSIVLSVLASSALFACSKAPPPGKPVSIAAVCDEPMQSRVRLQGFLRFVRGWNDPCSTTEAGLRRCTLELRESNERPPEDPSASPSAPSANVRLSLPVGDGPAAMNNLPSNFTGIGVVVHLESGANAVEGSYITIDGVVTNHSQTTHSPDAAGRCSVDVDWVQAGSGN